MSPFERAARAAKVAKLVSAIDRTAERMGLAPHRDARQLVVALRSWTDEYWQIAADEAGCNVPSWNTQREVIWVYEQRSAEPSVERSGVYERRSA